MKDFIPWLKAKGATANLRLDPSDRQRGSPYYTCIIFAGSTEVCHTSEVSLADAIAKAQADFTFREPDHG